MIELEVKCVGSLNYEHEDLEFSYKDVLMFRQYGKSLNRGGRGLKAVNAGDGEVIMSCGRGFNYKSWCKKLESEFSKIGFKVSALDILEEVERVRALNIREHNAKVNTDILNVEGDIKKLQKTIDILKKDVSLRKRRLIKQP